MARSFLWVNVWRIRSANGPSLQLLKLLDSRLEEITALHGSTALSVLHMNSVDGVQFPLFTPMELQELDAEVLLKEMIHSNVLETTELQIALTIVATNKPTNVRRLKLAQDNHSTPVNKIANHHLRDINATWTTTHAIKFPQILVVPVSNNVLLIAVLTLGHLHHCLVNGEEL